MSNDRFVGTVVDVKDPELAGRVKIRIYGIHDDKSRVPDDMLPWARCIFPVTNPVSAGVAGATTGMVIGTTVVGYFADPYKQVALVDGTLGSVKENKTDFPAINAGEDVNPVLNDSVLHIGTSELKFLAQKTIGSVKFVGQDMDKLLSEIKEGDIKGSIRAAKDVVKSFKAIKDFIQNSPLEQINSVIQGYASDLSTLAEDEIQSLITNELGNIVSFVGEERGAIEVGANVANKALGSMNHILGALGTRQSKSPISTAQDALNKLSGHRFVMGNMMGALDSSLAKLRIQMNKGN